MKQLLVSLIVLFLVVAAQAQTNGDLAFVGWNSDGTDDVAFVTFVNIPEATIFHFRDDEYTNSTWDGTGEGTFSWTAPAGGVAAGTVVKISALSSSAPPASVGVCVRQETGFDIINSENAVYMYQATLWSNAPFTFIAAFCNATGFGGLLNGTGLADGTDAWSWGDRDNWVYTGIRTGTVAELKAAMQNSLNWTNTDGTGDQSINFDLSPFQINLPDPNAVVIITTNPPTDFTTVSNSISTYDLQGTASTSVVGTMKWTNWLTGASGSIAASTNWTIPGVALNVGANFIIVYGTNNNGSQDGDSLTITREAAPPPAHTIAFINEVECNGAGTDSNDFIEIIAPAGTNLQGAFLIHYNGTDASDADLFRFDFPEFIVPDDGITDTNGVHLGFCVIAQDMGAVANSDFAMPSPYFQQGPDGAVLYDASSNILDAVAWGGAGDLPVDDPGTVVTTGDPAASNYLAVLANDSGTAATLQSPNKVLADNGNGWIETNATPGAINLGQTSGQIDITGGSIPNPPSITITNPANFTIINNVITAYDVSGDCNTNVAGEISWSNSLTGGTGTIGAATNWTVSIPVSVGVNIITVSCTNNSGNSASDSESILRSAAETYTGSPKAFINEVEPDSSGNGDSNDYVEIIAPAGSNLVGCFLIHYNGADTVDTDIWRFDFPSFVVPDDGVTDTNGVHLGFCVIALTNGPGVPNTDFELPGGLQTGPDGLVLYDAASNILDAWAWVNGGDLYIDDPGTVTISGWAGANNLLIQTDGDGDNTNTTLQAMYDVGFPNGSYLWPLIPGTPGAINGVQTNGQIIFTMEGGVNPDSDADNMPDAWELDKFGTLTNEAAGNNDGDTSDNLEEYLADTNPTNSDSCLGFVSFSLGTSENVAKWKGGTQAVQIVEYRSNLISGGWTILSSFPAPTPVTNTLGIGPSPSTEFYRLRVHR